MTLSMTIVCGNILFVLLACHAVTSFIDEKSASSTEFANEDPIPRFTCNVTAQFHSQGHVMEDSQQ